MSCSATSRASGSGSGPFQWTVASSEEKPAARVSSDRQPASLAPPPTAPPTPGRHPPAGRGAPPPPPAPPGPPPVHPLDAGAALARRQVAADGQDRPAVGAVRPV